MDNKLLKRLIDYSYINNNLSIKRINKIARLFKNRRQDMKQYLKGLKKRERTLSISIDVSMPAISRYKNKFADIFPNKKIIWNVDSSLMLGLRVTDNDNVLEMSLKKTLNDIMSAIEQNYD